jgi:hypothetical protein
MPPTFATASGTGIRANASKVYRSAQAQEEHTPEKPDAVQSGQQHDHPNQ